MENNPIKRMAAGMIALAFKDYERPKGKDYESAKKWFEEKGRETFGFYWCLEHSEWNPNLVRKHLNNIEKEREKKLETMKNK